MNVEALSFLDDSGRVVNENSWTSLLKTACFKPLIKLYLRESRNPERNASRTFDHELRSDSSSDSSDGWRASPGPSSFTSYGIRGEVSTNVVRNIETELQQAYEALEEARSRDEYEDIYALDFRQIPDIENRLLASLNHIYEDGLKRADDPSTGSKNPKDSKKDKPFVDIGRVAYDRLTREQKRQLAGENRFEHSRMPRTLREITDLSVIEVEREEKSSSDSEPSVENSPDTYGHGENWNERKHYRSRGEPVAAQYIPSRASIAGALQRLDPQIRLGNKQFKRKHETYCDVAMKSAERDPTSSPAITNALKDVYSIIESAVDFLSSEQSEHPFFYWPLGLKLRMDLGTHTPDHPRNHVDNPRQEVSTVRSLSVPPSVLPPSVLYDWTTPDGVGTE